MNSATLDNPKTEPEYGTESNQFEYRSISKAAVAALVFGVLGLLLAFMAQTFVILPALGIGFGFLAMSNLRRYPEELTGRMSAKIGLVMSLVVFFSAVGYHTYVYQTEVPDGYIRMAFSDLRPNPKTPQIPYSSRSVELDGQKVFVKGYVRPGAKKRKLKKFILVGDFGSCCFGGSVKATDIIAVAIKGDETVDYGYSLRRLSGTFRLNRRSRQTDDKGLPGVYYELETDQVR